MTPMRSSSFSILRAALVVAGLLAATACNDATPETTSTDSSDSGEASTSSGTSTPSPTSSGLDSTGTGSTSTGSTTAPSTTDASTDAATGSTSDASTGSTSTGSTSDASTGSTSDAATGSTSDASTGSTSDPSTGSTSDASTGSTGGDAGFCALVCIDVNDCIPPGGDPADWACTDGFCEYVGAIPPCDPLTCPAAAGLTCALVDGVSVCVIPCVLGGNQCDLFMFECTGVTDMGGMICQPPPCNGAAEGDPCDISGVGQVGICTGGVCMCTDDAECTAAGYACTL